MLLSSPSMLKNIKTKKILCPLHVALGKFKLVPGGLLLFCSESIEVRAIFCQGVGVGVVNHLSKNSRNLPKFLQNNRKETRVI